MKYFCKNEVQQTKKKIGFRKNYIIYLQLKTYFCLENRGEKRLARKRTVFLMYLKIKINFKSCSTLLSPDFLRTRTRVGRENPRRPQSIIWGQDESVSVQWNWGWNWNIKRYSPTSQQQSRCVRKLLRLSLKMVWRKWKRVYVIYLGKVIIENVYWPQARIYKIYCLLTTHF